MFSSRNNNFNGNFTMPSSIGGQLLFVLLTMIVVALLIAGLVFLIKVAQDCLTNAGYYEPFDTSSPKTYTNLLEENIKKVQQLNIEFDENIDLFTENTEITCDVYNQVEDIYVENNSGPTSESEYNLPKDKLDKLLKRRRESAKKRFYDARSIFGKSRGGGIYECFTNESEPSIPELEDDLRTELILLNTKIMNLQASDLAKKVMPLDTLQKFNAKYIKKTTNDMSERKEKVVEGYATSSSNATVKNKEDEQRLQEVQKSIQKSIQSKSGEDLLREAKYTIDMAERIKKLIQDQNKTAKTQMELVEEMKKTTDRISEGNVTAADVSA